MRRSKRKKKILQRLPWLSLLVVFPAILVISYLCVAIRNFDLLVITVLSGLWSALAYFLRYVAAWIIIIFIIVRLVRSHQGETRTQWSTYLNMDIYLTFASQPSDIEPTDFAYWQNEKRIQQKKLEKGEDFKVAVSGAGIVKNADYMERINHLADKNASIAKESLKYALLQSEEPLKCSDETAQDELEDLPEFDPNGPKPFKD